MKLFIFVTYLWVIAFSQIINASSDKTELPAPKESITLITAVQDQFYCREDVRAEKSFEEQAVVTFESTACDQAYNDQQTQISERREKHEHVIWSTITPTEIVLAEVSTPIQQ